MGEWDTQKQLEACVIQTHVMQYLNYNHRGFVPLWETTEFRGSYIIYLLKSWWMCFFQLYRGFWNIHSVATQMAQNDVDIFFIVRNFIEILVRNHLGLLAEVKHDHCQNFISDRCCRSAQKHSAFIVLVTNMFCGLFSGVWPSMCFIHLFLLYRFHKSPFFKHFSNQNFQIFLIIFLLSMHIM